MIALVDCNNFYASCERLFCPTLRNKPIVILSNNDGCVIARSNEAKALGIEMGAPAFLAKRQMAQHGVTVFSSNYTLYGSISNRVLHVLGTFSPDMEVYSIDEAFLEIPVHQNENLHAFGLRIRDTVMKEVGIPVTVGIAATKTLAKMANHYAKRESKQSGVYVAATPAEVDTLLQFTDVADIWGIGNQHKKQLVKLGLHKAKDLLPFSEEWLRKNLTVTGVRMLYELRGIPCIAVETMLPSKQGICVARSFGSLLRNKADIREALANYAAAAALKLREQRSCAQLMQVYLQTNTHRTGDRQYFRMVTIPLTTPTNDASQIIATAVLGLDHIFREGYNFKKVGILLQELIPEESLQMGIFEKRNFQRSKAMMETLDELNTRFGRNMLRYAAQGYSNKWHLKQQQLSRRYTTHIDEVLCIAK